MKYLRRGGQQPQSVPDRGEIFVDLQRLCPVEKMVLQALGILCSGAATVRRYENEVKPTNMVKRPRKLTTESFTVYGREL